MSSIGLVPKRPDDGSDVLRYILRRYGGTHELPDEERFRTAVRLAKLILKPKLDSDDALAKMLARNYLEHCEIGAKDIAEVVDDLIYETQQVWTKKGPYEPEDAYDTLICLVSQLHREHKPLPKNLDIWNADVMDDMFLDKAKKKRPRPTSKGPKKNTNLNRDSAFLDVRLELLKFGFSSTRYIEQKGKEYTDCCFEGGSAADIIGVAYKELTGVNIKYKTLVGILKLPKNIWV